MEENGKKTLFTVDVGKVIVDTTNATILTNGKGTGYVPLAIRAQGNWSTSYFFSVFDYRQATIKAVNESGNLLAPFCRPAKVVVRTKGNGKGMEFPYLLIYEPSDRDPEAVLSVTGFPFTQAQEIGYQPDREVRGIWSWWTKARNVDRGLNLVIALTNRANPLELLAWDGDKTTYVTITDQVLRETEPALQPAAAEAQVAVAEPAPIVNIQPVVAEPTPAVEVRRLPAKEEVALPIKVEKEPETRRERKPTRAKSTQVPEEGRGNGRRRGRKGGDPEALDEEQLRQLKGLKVSAALAASVPA